MDKKDIAYIACACGIILIIALIIKPMATGQPLLSGIAATTTEKPTILTPAVVSNISLAVKTTVIPTSIAPPSTMPTWNPNVVQTIGFVYPETYGVSFNSTGPSARRIPSSTPNTSMVKYATISGRYNGATQIVHVPFPSWTMSYTVEPVTNPGGDFTVSAVQTHVTEGVDKTSFTGSYSSVFPSITIQVMDANDPNRIARIISPPGEINPDDWDVTIDNVKIPDPRPWVETFYEGGRDYYFIINAHMIQSYTIDILVPQEYVGKY
jgi:hypothetical protein